MLPSALKWPVYAPDAAEVRAWVASVLPEHIEVTGPEKVYAVNDAYEGLTALFQTHSMNGDMAVVVKIVSKAYSPYTHLVWEMLSRNCHGDVPELLAWRSEAEHQWLLFQVFEGQTLDTLNQITSLTSMVRVVGRIQTKVAELPQTKIANLPRISVTKVPELLERLVERVARDFFPTLGPNLTHLYPTATSLAAHLLSFRPLLQTWSEELDAGGWPLTIDHADFSPRNAALLNDGNVVIYDWEEAVITCPFFVLDSPLNVAQTLEEVDPADPNLVGVSEDQSPNVRIVRDAYLESVPWGTRAARERALDLALCLSPIRFAYTETRAERFGGRDVPGWVSGDLTWWIQRALQRWERMIRV